MDYRKIIIKPLFTEKSNSLRSEDIYTFQVEKKANKIEIKLAVEKLFGVDVLDCRIVNLKGKVKKTRLGVGVTNSKKKAIIKVKKDQKIGLFE